MTVVEWFRWQEWVADIIEDGISRAPSEAAEVVLAAWSSTAAAALATRYGIGAFSWPHYCGGGAIPPASAAVGLA